MAHVRKDNVGFLVNQSARLLSKELGTLLKDLGLTPNQYALLLSIDAIRDRDVTAADVANDLRMEHSAVTHAVDRAVSHGWHTTRQHPEHPRVRLLELTPKAKTALPVMADAGRWTIEMGLNGFTREEVAQLRELLRRLLANLEATGA